MSITFYYTVPYDRVRKYMPNVPMLLPASSWSRVNLRRPPMPKHITEVAADSGGFVATFKWGDYRFTPEQYVRWLDTFNPSWAATMDYCCENEITSGRPGIVLERQQRTSAMAYSFWKDYRDPSWAWVPTIQGWKVEEYRRHAIELRPLIREMQIYFESRAPGRFRVGIGTLCNRANAEMVRRVAAAVAEELPGIPLHLWGVKLAVLRSPVALPHVISVDSAAWSVGGLKSDGIAARDEQKALGMTQREHEWFIQLPRYKRKVDAALAKPKQMSLL